MGKVCLFDEIWVIVFDFLRLRDVFQCMQISRRWCELGSLRLKSDTSLLKKWHETDRILYYHKRGLYRNKTKWLSGSSSIFIDDVGLLVVCQNDYDRITISFHSMDDHYVEYTLSYFHRWDNYDVILHYHKTEQRLVVHLKEKDAFFVVHNAVIDLSDLNNLEPIQSDTNHADFDRGRCQLCAQILPNLPKHLLPPSPVFYEGNTTLVFVNEPGLLRVGCISGDNSLIIFENGQPAKSIIIPRTEAKVIDSDHVFVYPFIINIKTDERSQVSGSKTDEFHQIGSHLLCKSNSDWQIVQKCGDQWHFSHPSPQFLLQKGNFPAFCARENRILFF
jgi:hypothetical protein